MNYSNIEDLYTIFLKHPQVQTDTRKLRQGDVFFALKGGNFNGNAFAGKAIEMGAAYVVIDEESFYKDERYILVEDVLAALQDLAAMHRIRSKARILAITGTNGKTTTKELIAAVLGSSFNIIYTQGNLNNHIGVPLTLLSIRKDTEIAIIEMGANHVGEIAAYCQWAKPDLGIITNVGKAHLEGFGSLGGVKKAKGELYAAVAEREGLLFQCKDAEHLQEMTPPGARIITYGTYAADISGTAQKEGITLSVAVSGPGHLRGLYPTQLAGMYNLPNVLAAITVGDFFGLGREVIQQAIGAYTPENNRSQVIHRGSNTIILDAYNANPSSMALALENIAGIPSENKWLLLGAMKEMGSNSDEEHLKVVTHAHALGLHNIILVGKEYETAADGILWMESSEDLLAYLQQEPIHNALVLIKGSRGSRMEKVLEAFE